MGVDELMTDLAAIFHWSLADMERLTLPELLRWRTRALDWWNGVHGGKKGQGADRP